MSIVGKLSLIIALVRKATPRKRAPTLDRAGWLRYLDPVDINTILTIFGAPADCKDLILALATGMRDLREQNRTLARELESAQMALDSMTTAHDFLLEDNAKLFAQGAPIVTSKPKRRRNRRTSADIAELTERLYRAVRAKPGESMAMLAVAVGATSDQLEYPMDILKYEGRVRLVGARCNTRYFPVKVRKG